MNERLLTGPLYVDINGGVCSLFWLKIRFYSLRRLFFKLTVYYCKFGNFREFKLTVNYCKFRNFREGFIMRSFVKMKSSRNVEITLSFTDAGKSCPSHEFLTSQICLLTLFAKLKLSRGSAVAQW